MRTRFDEQLMSLHEETLKMANMVEDSIRKAIKALNDNDKELARLIKEDDHFINNEQKKIESICYDLLIMQQPVASDLRFITAILKLVTDLERIGDHAADISEIVLEMEQMHVSLELLNKMALETEYMLVSVVEAFSNKDIEKAKYVIDKDDVVDGLFIEVKNEVIALFQKNDSNEDPTHSLLIAKYFERIGDHCTNIAEWVIFVNDSNKRQK